jgi:hypothetical protein
MSSQAQYPGRIPDEHELPADQVLVHNNVRPARRQGTRGFRFWLAKADDTHVLCECGWAPESGGHYRVRRSSG